MNVFIKVIMAGFFSAMVLGGFLKIVEQLTGKMVYVLLLNVDYFPIIKDWQLSEITAFLLHVFVSVILAIILYKLFYKLGISGKVFPYVLVSFLIGFTLFFTTTLSNRTPNIMDVAAFNYWMIGHLLYGMIVGCIIVYTEDIKG